MQSYLPTAVLNNIAVGFSEQKRIFAHRRA